MSAVLPPLLPYVLTDDLICWLVPPFIESNPLRKAIIVFQGKLISPCALSVCQQIETVADKITKNGCLLIHANSGDFGLSSNQFRSSGVIEIDSSGLKGLWDLNKYCQQRNIKLFVVADHPNLLRSFKMTGLSKTMTIFSCQKDLEKALIRFCRQ